MRNGLFLHATQWVNHSWTLLEKMEMSPGGKPTGAKFDQSCLVPIRKPAVEGLKRRAINETGCVFSPAILVLHILQKILPGNFSTKPWDNHPSDGTVLRKNNFCRGEMEVLSTLANCSLSYHLFSTAIAPVIENGLTGGEWCQHLVPFNMFKIQVYKLIETLEFMSQLQKYILIRLHCRA